MFFTRFCLVLCVAVLVYSQDDTTADPPAPADPATAAPDPPSTAAPPTAAPTTAAPPTAAPSTAPPTPAVPNSSVNITTDPCDSTVNNGVLELHCWGYKYCVNGFVNVLTCAAGLVFERETKSCVAPNSPNVNNDCLKPADCTNKVDGFYADKTANCKTFYRCVNGAQMGPHNYCPEDLQFNETTQACDYPANVQCNIIV